MSKPKHSNPLAQAWLVLLLSVLYGGGLAFINVTLSPIIAENIRNETYSLIPVLVGNPDEFDVSEELLELPNNRKLLLYKVEAPDTGIIGWVIPASALGFADNIQVLVGVDAQCSRITGIRVIDQKETPGLGNLIVADAFTGQFEGVSTQTPIRIVKLPSEQANEVLTVTGATVSSVTVADAVNQAIGLAKPYIIESIH